MKIIYISAIGKQHDLPFTPTYLYCTISSIDEKCFSILIFKNVFTFIYCVWVFCLQGYKVTVCMTGICRGQKRALDVLEQELNHLVGATAASALNHRATSPAPSSFLFLFCLLWSIQIIYSNSHWHCFVKDIRTLF